MPITPENQTQEHLHANRSQPHLDYLARVHGLSPDQIPDSWHIIPDPTLFGILTQGCGLANNHRALTPDPLTQRAYQIVAFTEGRCETLASHGPDNAAYYQPHDETDATVFISPDEVQAQTAFLAGAAQLCPYNGPLHPDWIAFCQSIKLQYFILHGPLDFTHRSAHNLEKAGISRDHIFDFTLTPTQILKTDGIEALAGALEKAPHWKDPDGLTLLSINEIFDLQLPTNDNILGDRILAAGESLAVFGAGGTGKSRILRQLAINSILNQPWCGFETNRYDLKWLILGPEDSPRKLKWELGRQLQGISIQDRDKIIGQLKILTPTKDVDRLLAFRDPQNTQRIAAEIQSWQPDVIVWDPAQMFFAGDDPNASQTMLDFYLKTRQLAFLSKSTTATIIAHHSQTGKSAAATAIGWDRDRAGKGSKTLHECVRGAINIAPGNADNHNTLVLGCGKASLGPEFKPLAVTLDPLTMTYHPEPDFDIDAWHAEVSRTRPDASGGRRSQGNASLVAILLRDGGGQLPAGKLIERLMEATNLSRATAERRIKDAVDQNLIYKPVIHGGNYSLPL